MLTEEGRDERFMVLCVGGCCSRYADGMGRWWRKEGERRRCNAEGGGQGRGNGRWWVRCDDGTLEVEGKGVCVHDGGRWRAMGDDGTMVLFQPSCTQEDR